MNKTDLQDKINSLPEFRFRDVAVKDFEITANDDPTEPEIGHAIWTDVSKNHRAITETTKTDPVAFVSPRYKMIQFKEAFSPILDPLPEETTGCIVQHSGRAVMDFFLPGEEFQMEKGRIGVTVYNSVDTTASIGISFLIEDDQGRRFAVPASVARPFKKAHVGKVKIEASEYAKFLGSVKAAWDLFVTKASQTMIGPLDLKDCLEGFGYDESKFDALRLRCLQAPVPLWDVIIEIYNHIQGKSYKSEVHRRDRLDELAKNIFNYKLLMKIGGI